jgi:multidrug efflux pump subunit AcrA (membrane-fusion protein)
MTSWRAVLAGVIAIAVAVGIGSLYLQHRGEMAQEGSREAPIVAPSRLESGEDGPVVALDSSEERRIGLETTVLDSASQAAPARLAAEGVEEPERVAAIRAPLAGRLTASGDAWPTIGRRLAAGEEIGRVSDARPLAVPLAGVVTRVGARPGEIVEAGQLLLEVVDRSHPVVRVVWSVAGAPRPGVLLAPAGGTTRVRARLIGPASEADPLTRRPVYLYRAERAWPGGTPGTPVVALVPSGAAVTSGAVVPDRAVVQWDGLTWAYRRRNPGRYERVRVLVDRPLPEAWLVTGNLFPGDTVVVTGAQELLSEEFRARVTVGDEAGE